MSSHTNKEKTLVPSKDFLLSSLPTYTTSTTIVLFHQISNRYSSYFNGRILNPISDGDQESSGYYLQLLQEHDEFG
ncbi:hypothetical protein MRB53_026363 [Persea americana]|uniref:Uncharacterized protein n=1 Tax=Persea americana TaxID=3435 RepID=A0ACC2LHR8_PERAE|nr:hypothetical protein MRB53_026363 [Persea americana]